MDERIVVNVRSTLKEEVIKAATAVHKDQSEWVREAIVEKLARQDELMNR